MSDGSITITAEIDTSEFEKGLKSLISSAKKFAGAIAGIMGAAGLVGFLKDSVAAADSLSGAMTGLQSIVEGQGRSLSKATKFLEEYTKDGLIPMTSAVTAYKNLASRGYSDEQITSTLTALKDASAFGRQARLSMGQAVATATEGLRNENSILVDNSGVTKNVSIMWKEYAATIGKTVGNLTQQEKIQAEVNGILNETRFQTGNAAKVTMGYAGQISRLQASFIKLKEAVGSSLIPILQKIIPYIQFVINKLIEFFNVAAKVIAKLFGKEAQPMQAASAGMASSAENAAGAQKDLGKATKKAAKEVKGALAPFDELNILMSKSADSADDLSDGLDSGAADPGGGLGGGIDVPINVNTDDAELDALVEKIRKFFAGVKEFLIKLGFDFNGDGEINLRDLIDKIQYDFAEAWGKAIQAVKDFKDTFIGIIEVTIRVAQGFYENFVKPITQWLLGIGVPQFLQIIQDFFNSVDWGGAIENLNAIWQTLSKWEIFSFSSILDFMENFLKPLAQYIVGEGLERLRSILEFIDKSVNWDKLKESLKTLYSTLAELAKIVFTSLLVFIEHFLAPIAVWTMNEALPKLVELFEKLVNNINWDKLLESVSGLWDILEKFAENVGNGLLWFLENVLEPLAEWTISDFLPVFLDTLGKAVKFLDEVFSAFMEIFKEVWEKFFKPIAEWTGGMIVDILAKIGDIIKVVGDKINENKETWVKYCEKVGEILNKVWEGFIKPILDKIKEIFNEVIGTVIIPLIEVVMDKLRILGIVFTEVILPIISLLVDKLRPAFEIHFNAIASVVQLAVKMISASISTVRDVLEGIIEFISIGFKDGWKAAFDALPRICEEVFSKIKDTLKGIGNAVIDVVNSITRAINFVLSGLKFDIPDWIPGLGGKSFGLNIPKVPEIPHLAEGAVIPPNREFAAILGDQTRGRNIEAPEGLIRQIVASENSSVVSMLAQVLEAIKQGKNIYMDGEVLARTNASNYRALDRANGY